MSDPYATPCRVRALIIDDNVDDITKLAKEARERIAGIQFSHLPSKPVTNPQDTDLEHETGYLRTPAAIGSETNKRDLENIRKAITDWMPHLLFVDINSGDKLAPNHDGAQVASILVEIRQQHQMLRNTGADEWWRTFPIVCIVSNHIKKSTCLSSEEQGAWLDFSLTWEKTGFRQPARIIGKGATDQDRNVFWKSILEHLAPVRNPSVDKSLTPEGRANAKMAADLWLLDGFAQIKKNRSDANKYDVTHEDGTTQVGLRLCSKGQHLDRVMTLTKGYPAVLATRQAVVNALALSKFFEDDSLGWIAHLSDDSKLRFSSRTAAREFHARGLETIKNWGLEHLAHFDIGAWNPGLKWPD